MQILSYVDTIILTNVILIHTNTISIAAEPNALKDF